MRIALFADVHANKEALEACLHHARSQKINRYVFLGDLIGYGADPGWVLDTVMHHQEEVGGIVVLGNHDEAVFAPPDRTMHDDARYAVEWTRSRLSDRQKNFLLGLPRKADLSDAIFVHANAWDPGNWQYITSVFEAKKSLAATVHRFTFCGHLHEPDMYHQGTIGKVAQFKPVAGIDIPLGIHRRWLVVLGAVGQPRDGNPAACYGIYDKMRNIFTYHRVPFDTDTTARKIREAGLPEWLGARLERGM